MRKRTFGSSHGQRNAVQEAIANYGELGEAKKLVEETLAGSKDILKGV